MRADSDDMLDPLPTSDVADNWTPIRGLVYGVIAAVMAAIVVSVLLAPLAWFIPVVAFHWSMRALLGFVVMWVLCGVVQGAAGFVAWPVTLIAYGGTMLVLFSQNAILAVHGLPVFEGVRPPLGSPYLQEPGWHWLAPFTLVIMNYTAMVCAGVAGWMCHDGGAGSDSLAAVLTGRIWRV